MVIVNRRQKQRVNFATQKKSVLKWGFCLNKIGPQLLLLTFLGNIKRQL